MRGYRVVVLAFLLAAGLSLACVPPSCGGVVPSLQVPALYMGEHTYDGGSYQVALHLTKSRAFLLRERVVLANGKESAWEVNGRWYQIRDRAFVQLTNRRSYSRLMNVGGKGALYLDMKLPGGREASVTLRSIEYSPLEFTISGMLRPSGKKLLFREAESRIEFRVLPGDAVNAFMKERASGEKSEMPVQVTAVLERDAEVLPEIRLTDIKSITPDRKWDLITNHTAFADAVAESKFKLTTVYEESTAALCLLAFYPDRKNAGGGRVEIYDGFSSAAGTYIVNNSSLRLSVSGLAPETERMIKQIRYWQQVGEVVELWGGDDRLLALLEKVR